MTKNGQDTFDGIRGPGALSLGLPGAALALLLVVVWGNYDERLFFFFNGFSEYTGSAFWANVTLFGDGLVCAVLLLPWIRRHPERVWGALLGALLMVIILRTFKGAMSLPRPLGVLSPEVVTVIGPGHRRSAFPSGHAATMALLAGAWALSSRRRLVPWLAVSAAVLVGVSRMAVGVHWPSDVLAGLALGWTTAWIGLRWARRFPWGSEGVGHRILTGALFVSAAVLLIFDHTGYPGVVWVQRAVALGCIAWGFREIRR